MVEFLEQQGTVFNYDDIVRNLTERAGRFISEIDLQESLEKEAKIYYFSKDAKTYNEICTSEDDNVVLKIIETIFIDKTSKYPLCISFMKKGTNWDGCYVGTRYYLFNKLQAKSAGPVSATKSKSVAGDPVKDASIAITAVTSSELTFLQQVYAVLYYKEDWEHDGNLNRLGTYISTLRKKIDNDIVKGKRQNVIFNNTGTKYIFNSKLLDCFGNYIHIMAEKCSTRHYYVASRQFLKEQGFEVSVLNVPPVEFFTDISDVVFKADIDDIDLSDVASLHHIINERRFRFPEAVRNKSDIEIMNCLRVSIDHSVKMSKIDYKFVVPMYNLELDKIQFLMPVYFDFGESKKADVALVLNNSNGIWQVKTILPLESAFCNARLISSLSTSWLNLKE